MEKKPISITLDIVDGKLYVSEGDVNTATYNNVVDNNDVAKYVKHYLDEFH